MKKKLMMMAISTPFIISGCATTADYAEPVSRLEKAVNDAASSIKSIDAEITQRKNATLTKQILSNPLVLETAKGECTDTSKKCSLIVESKTDGIESTTINYPLKSSMPKALKALEMIEVYVNKLSLIVKADTTSKVISSANSTFGSLQDISNQIAKDSGNSINKIAEYKEPTINVIEWITGKYVEHVKKEALANATNAAHPIIINLTEFYATSAQSSKLAKFADTKSVFIDKQEAFDSNKDMHALEEYVKASTEYNLVLEAQSANPLKAFEVAHERLTKQLNATSNNIISLAEVELALNQFEEEVKKVKSLIDDFKEAAKD